jgi:hypothetical protein
LPLEEPDEPDDAADEPAEPEADDPDDEELQAPNNRRVVAATTGTLRRSMVSSSPRTGSREP